MTELDWEQAQKALENILSWLDIPPRYIAQDQMDQMREDIDTLAYFAARIDTYVETARTLIALWDKYGKE